MNSTIDSTRTGKARFRLTYEVITEESAENGDTAQAGFLPRSGAIPFSRSNMPDKPAQFTLRQALTIRGDTYDGREPVHADSCPISLSYPPRWFTWGTEIANVFGHPHRGIAGNVLAVNLSLHLPRDISPASAIRVARLLSCYGLR